LIVGGTDVAYDPATTTGTASGKLNVVSKRVVVEGDLRFLSPEQLDRARQRMRAIVAANLPQTSAAISFEDGMPSMPPTDGNRAVLRRLDQVSRDLGAEPIGEQDPSQRGAGDIAFVATLVDGLDGLGAMGEQEHAPGEYVELDQMPLLTKRAALLIYRLTSPGAAGRRGEITP
jgi:glutamate carboxypeptidase